MVVTIGFKDMIQVQKDYQLYFNITVMEMEKDIEEVLQEDF